MSQTEAGRNLGVLIFSLWIPFIASMQCPHGQYGYYCDMQCKCVDQPQCNVFDGHCEVCKPGMFGPGCQYINLMTELALPETPPYLMDGDINTCNPNPKEISLTVSLTRSVQFTWFRLHTKEDFSQRDMFVMLDEETCPVRRVYRVSENVLDVSCEKTRLHKQLRIDGPIVGYICELGISWGRNVAINQKTAQNNFAAKSLSNSSNAVDGSTNNQYEDGSCIKTDDNPTISWWTVEYRLPQRLIRVLVYNTNSNSIRLSGFVLELYEKLNDTKPAFTYNTDTKKITMVYDIDVPLLTPPVMKVKIWKSKGDQDNENILTLCEVETYGDHVCQKGRYGPPCVANCTCKNNQHCNVITGICGTACEIIGHYSNCSYPCQPNCVNNECLNAKCVSCKPKFIGPYCDKECPDGMYGEHCNQNCSKNCQGRTCNLTNGHCSACTGQQAMPFCEDNDDTEKFHMSAFNWIYIVPVLVLLPLVMLLICCFWRKKSVEPAVPAPEAQPAPKPVKKEPPPDPQVLTQMGSSVDISVGQTPGGAGPAENA